ncbi:MAG: hypothetical protein KJO67_01850 [Silicimonas sp.]|nr:hypothetical protein [Silicimonas sp.]NND21425.1 hypothetical protein [Silicimonas sp.]
MELEVLSMFPEDEVSLRQAQHILKDEHQRLQRLGAEEFVPSKLAQIVMHGFDKSVTSRATATLVALAMIGLDDIGEKMSLRRAAAVVSEYSNSDHGTTFFRRTGSEIKISKKALVGDSSDIAKNFRKHRAVAHILAAKAALSDHQKLGKDLISSSLVDQHFLSTVLYFQKRLSQVRNFADWNMWWIEVEPNSEIAKLPEPWLPKQETISNILEPWEMAGKPIG